MLALICICFWLSSAFYSYLLTFFQVKNTIYKGFSSKVFPNIVVLFAHWSWQRITWMCRGITGKNDTFIIGWLVCPWVLSFKKVGIKKKKKVGIPTRLVHPFSTSWLPKISKSYFCKTLLYMRICST